MVKDILLGFLLGVVSTLIVLTILATKTKNTKKIKKGE